MRMSSSSFSKRLAIVGAGAAGLCAARRAVAHLPDWVPVVFESMNQVGGTWIYEDIVGIHPSTGEPTHSSMYKGLRTNLPKEVMAFPDFPFSSHNNNNSSFLTHAQVLSYLKDYAANILQYIQFTTKIVSIAPIPGSRWQIETLSLTTKNKSISEFDAVVICNGHYSTPHFGAVKDADLFTGRVLHSHDYRVPEPFTDQRVLVFGAAASGIDIGIEISRVAKKVYLSHNNSLYPNLSSQIEQVKGLASCSGGSSFLLGDGSSLENIDALIYCTGYEYTFPFLHPDCGIRVDSLNRRIHDLYKHCINAAHPSMCLVGIPMHVCPFPLFDTQLRFFYASLQDSVLPALREDMLQDIQREFDERRSRGLEKRHFHKFGDYQWEYLEDLASRGGFSGISSRVQELYNLVSEMRRKDILNYRESVFVELNGRITLKGIE